MEIDEIDDIDDTNMDFEEDFDELDSSALELDIDEDDF